MPRNRWTRSARRLLPLLPVLLAGCSVTRGLAVRSFAPILHQSVESAYRDQDLATIREGIPGNLILLRGLCESQPGNEDLRSMAAQMYFSYAMGFVEDQYPARARMLYQEGLRLGREGLMRHAWFRRAEAQGSVPTSSMLSKAGKGDVPLLFWTLANWSSWIALNLSEPEAIAQLPRLQVYLDRVLELEPEFFQGMPHVLAGTLLTFRPRMLGGNPEEGKRHFDEAFRISQRRMLIFQTVYARYYCHQMLDEECFDSTLKEVLDAPVDLNPAYRLLNQVAKEKARHLQEIRDELF
jgi:hypothetical protein